MLLFPSFTFFSLPLYISILYFSLYFYPIYILYLFSLYFYPFFTLYFSSIFICTLLLSCVSSSIFTLLSAMYLYLFCTSMFPIFLLLSFDYVFCIAFLCMSLFSHLCLLYFFLFFYVSALHLGLCLASVYLACLSASACALPQSCLDLPL